MNFDMRRRAAACALLLALAAGCSHTPAPALNPQHTPLTLQTDILCGIAIAKNAECPQWDAVVFDKLQAPYSAPYIENYAASGILHYSKSYRNADGTRQTIEHIARSYNIREENRRYLHKLSIARHTAVRFMRHARTYTLTWEQRLFFEGKTRHESTPYRVTGRDARYDVEMTGFSIFSAPLCAQAIVAVTLRARLKPAYAPQDGSVRRYWHDHVFFAMEQSGPALFYPAPGSPPLPHGPALLRQRAQPGEYHCAVDFLQNPP